MAATRTSAFNWKRANGHIVTSSGLWTSFGLKLTTRSLLRWKMPPFPMNTSRDENTPPARTFPQPGSRERLSHVWWEAFVYWVGWLLVMTLTRMFSMNRLSELSYPLVIIPTSCPATESHPAAPGAPSPRSLVL